MSFRVTALKQHYFTLFVLAVFCLPAWAQDQNSGAGTAPTRPILFNDTDGIVTSLVTSPSFSSQANGAGATGNTQWLKVELHYSVNTGSDQIKFLTQATFKVWIEGLDLYDPRGAPGQGIAVALTGSVTHVNLPAGRDNYAAFYVHPFTLDRYSSASGYTDFDPNNSKFNIHAEALVKGQLSDYYDKKKEQDLNWFKPLKVITGLVYRQNQCAFIIDSPGRYPPILMEDKDTVSSSSDSAAPPPAPAPAPAP